MLYVTLCKIIKRRVGEYIGMRTKIQIVGVVGMNVVLLYYNENK
jgi:hypothetical protein